MATAGAEPKLTVWYNTKCSACNAGITWQRNRLVRAAREGLIDSATSISTDAMSRYGANVNDVRRRLHAVDADGRLHVGADCAIAIWRVTRGHAWLGRLFGLPLIRPITRVVYDRFADLLFAWDRWMGHW